MLPDCSTGRWAADPLQPQLCCRGLPSVTSLLPAFNTPGRDGVHATEVLVGTPKCSHLHKVPLHGEDTRCSDHVGRAR